MPSGSKQKKLNFNHLKPQGGYVHPSLAIRPLSSSVGHNTAAEGPSTVNERIEHLRRTQTQHEPSQSLNEAGTLIRGHSLERRRIAGPPPPRSWIEEREQEQNAIKIGSTRVASQGRRPNELGYFPGVGLPDPSSLMHHALKALAMDIDWHVDFDHYYLSTIPVKLKGVLLTYVARYGSPDGVSLRALKMLFATPQRSEMAESTGTEDLNRLDLGGSVGRSLTLPQLGTYWNSRKSRNVIPQTVVPDTWDAPSIPTSLESQIRFPALTRLSLAFPGSRASWSDLLHFSQHLSTLTHLSLASWPTPRLASRVEPTASLVAPSRNTSTESEWAEAAHILRQLSRNTPSLQYLDLDGCTDWLQALYTEAVAPDSIRIRPRGARDRGHFLEFTDNPGETTRTARVEHVGGAEWTGAWRHISHVSVRQGWTPKGMNLQVLHALYKARGRAETQLDALPPPTLHQDEAYGLFSSSHAVRESVQAQMDARHQRDAWYKMEVEALVAERHVRGTRSDARARGAAGGGNGPCVFEHGWGRHELLEAGYEDDDLWEAGF